jgi:hypothetical protein
MAEDPVRLRDDGGSELVRSLLSAAREEQPNRAAIERTLTVVGVGSAVAALTSSSSAATATVASALGGKGVIGAASLSSAKGAWGATVLVVVKWLGAGLVTGVVAGSALYVAREPSNPAPQPTSQKVAPTEPAKRAAPLPAVPAAATPPAVDATEPPTIAKVPASAPVVVGPSTAARAPVSDGTRDVDPDAQLAAESSLLDRARQALASGDTASALRSLNDYDARFAHPNLLPEALYLRLQALTAQGDQPGIRAVAQRLLGSSPNGPHAARARAVLGVDE